MTVYGITRASTRKQQASPEVQAEMIRKHCATVGLPEPTILDEPLGTSGRTTDFRNRPQGRWLLLNAQPGDVLVVTKLDRLGRTARDILDTLEQFAKRGVRVIVIQFLGGQNIDMDSTVGRLVVIFFAGLAQFEADMIGERTAERFSGAGSKGWPATTPALAHARWASGASGTCSSWPTSPRSPSGWAKVRTYCLWWPTSGDGESRTIAGYRGAKSSTRKARGRGTVSSGSGGPLAGFTG